jgi:hypothetical protein
MWIKDNFLDDVDYVRQLALGQNYRTIDTNGKSYYKGHRADVPDEIYNEVAPKILEELKLDRARIEMYFAYQTKDVTTTDEFSKHVDLSEYAGVIYLTPKPSYGSGTILYNERTANTNIANKYNRLVAYNSKVLHAPGVCFGDNINNARMTLTFFIHEA